MTGSKSAKYGSSFHKSPLFLAKTNTSFRKHPHVAILNTRMYRPLHPGVKGDNMGVFGN